MATPAHVFEVNEFTAGRPPALFTVGQQMDGRQQPVAGPCRCQRTQQSRSAAAYGCSGRTAAATTAIITSAPMRHHHHHHRQF